jgi:hypothetical protein
MPGEWRAVTRDDSPVLRAVRAQPDRTRKPVKGSTVGVATAASGVVVTDKGGRVLDHVKVHLIFWGTYWAGSPSPTAGEIFNAAQSIVSGPYMDGLSQYRGIQRGTVIGSTLMTAPVGHSPADPPTTFTDANVQNLVSDLIFSQVVPTPSDSQVLYIVILPPGVSSADNPNYIGEHNHYTYYAFPLYWANVHFGWVTNNGTLDGVTEIFSHELVEACTDPDPGDGFVVTADRGGGPANEEIGDICEGNDERINGVLVQRYFSVRHDQCIGDQAVKDHKDNKDSKDGKSESKDTKDHKDHKETKDGKDKDKDAKEKDAKEKDRDRADTIPSVLTAISRQIAQLAQQLGEQANSGTDAEAAGQAEPFIGADERPSVGDDALREE